MNGIINILKPAGITSNAVLSILKKKLDIKKVGHLGTLDPSGTGVLPITIGKATKLFDYYLRKNKTYYSVFVFGKETTTLDSDGEIIAEQKCNITASEISNVLPKLIGKQLQVPPKVSAKNVNGVRAYKLASQNVDFELAPKQVEIFSIELVSQISTNQFLFKIDCSSGTYVRSIVRDMSKLLNTVGYMGAIIRTKSGNFEIKNAVLLDDVTEKDVISLDKVLENREKVFIPDGFYDKIINGIEYQFTEHFNQNDVVVYCKNELIGIADVVNGLTKVKTYLKE